eukprot:1281677-Amphidinium_carterae.1
MSMMMMKKKKMMMMMMMMMSSVVRSFRSRFANELGRRDYVTGQMWKNKGVMFGKTPGVFACIANSPLCTDRPSPRKQAHEESLLLKTLHTQRRISSSKCITELLCHTHDSDLPFLGEETFSTKWPTRTGLAIVWCFHRWYFECFSESAAKTKDEVKMMGRSGFNTSSHEMTYPLQRMPSRFRDMTHLWEETFQQIL